MQKENKNQLISILHILQDTAAKVSGLTTSY